MESYDQPMNELASDAQDEAQTAMAHVEEAAAAALEKVETFVKENPLTALVGIGAAGALIGLAIASRKSQPLDRRLLNELNRHSESMFNAVRKNAGAAANSDTAQAVENFVSNLVSQLVKVPEAVSKQVNNLTN